LSDARSTIENMVDVSGWWCRLGKETQAWLVGHCYDDIPPDISDQVEAAGGAVYAATWVSDSREALRVHFLLPPDQLWIETRAGFEGHVSPRGFAE